MCSIKDELGNIDTKYKDIDSALNLVREHNSLLGYIADISYILKHESDRFTESDIRIMNEQLNGMTQYSDYLIVRIEGAIYWTFL